jgi:hypothetical protein
MVFQYTVVPKLPTVQSGREKDALVRIDQVNLTPGLLTVDGTAQVIDDLQRLFVYLRVVSSMPEEVPVAGATVELIELDSPAPSGDDVIVPPSVDTDQFTSKYEIMESATYEPQSDESLGSAVTDVAGLVSFAVFVNAVGGMYTDTKTVQDIRTEVVVSSTTQHRIVFEALPDLGVTITAADGSVLAKRTQIAVNVANRRLGSREHPFTLHVMPPMIMG